MKMVMMALLGLVLLGGGAAGAYFYFAKPAEAASGGEENHEKNAKKEEKKKEGDGHGGEGAGGVNFVRIDPLVLPIIDEDGVSEVVSLVVVLEVPDIGVATEVRMLQPRLKDAFIQEMYGVLNKSAALEGGVLKVTDIKQRLNRISQRVMGEGKVNDVLLEVVQQRPI